MSRTLKSAMGGKTAVVITVAVAIAAALGFAVQRKLSRPDLVAVPALSTPAASGAAAADATPSSSSAAPETAALKVPDMLPQFVLTDRDGKQRKLSEWAGRPLAVNFWATWCAPCRREIPLLSKLRRDRAAQKLEIIGIAVDFREDVLKYAAAAKIDYPLLIGEEEGLAAVKDMGVQPQFPFTVFADSRQRIVALKVGELHQDDADLILDRVADVDAGRLEMSAARDQISEGLKALATKRTAIRPSPAG